MESIFLVEFLPSALAAVASIAAAFAALGSLRVGREAKRLAEKAALADHHSAAVALLSEELISVNEYTSSLVRLSRRLWIDWSSEIGALDELEKGGVDPRPLRHVLGNGVEMLVAHGKEKNGYRGVGRNAFSIVRDGINQLDDVEYAKLLQIADKTYSDFEATFGKPKQQELISEARAFRWVIYQLQKRIGMQQWRDVWKKGWSDDGWLTRYKKEYEEVSPMLRETMSKIKREKVRLSNSTFPLNSNPKLAAKFDLLLEVLEIVDEDCDMGMAELYGLEPHDDDLIALVIYTMAISYLLWRVVEEAMDEMVTCAE